MATLLHHQTGN